jgi:hypothetical protein
MELFALGVRSSRLRSNKSPKTSARPRTDQQMKVIPDVGETVNFDLEFLRGFLDDSSYLK